MATKIIKAKYNTETSYCSVYLCINKTQIQGVFGEDYIKIYPEKNFLLLQLVEMKHHNLNGKIINQRKSSMYGRSGISYKDFIPGKYFLFFSRRSGIALTLGEEITNKKQKNLILSKLKEVEI